MIDDEPGDFAPPPFKPPTRYDPKTDGPPTDLCYGLACPHHDCTRYLALEGRSLKIGQEAMATCVAPGGTFPLYYNPNRREG